MNLDKLFNPKSIAIVGASAENGKIGNVIAKNILELGYEGKTFLVNPKRKEILDKECFGSLLEIEGEIDLAIITVPAKFVNQIIQEAGDRVKNFIVIAAGFSETGPEGQKREEELKKIIETKKVNVLGPNCLGLISPKIKLNASFASGMPMAGNICFISQSGALAVALMDIARKENMGFSRIISVGNKLQLSECELLRYFEKDNEVGVVGIYLESIKNGKEFLETAQKISRVKPVIILKAGKTEKSQKAISSHTGALSGSAEIMSEAFRKAGIIEAQNLEEFFSFLNFFSIAVMKKPSSGSKEIAVLTNAGGPGVLLADAFYKKEIKLAEITEATKENLKKFLPAEASVQNPVDLLGDALEDRYAKALTEISQQKNIGTIVALLTPQEQTPVEKIADELVSFSRKNKEIQVVASFIGGEKVGGALKNLKKNNIAIFPFPEQAILALEKYSAWITWKNEPVFEKDNASEEKRKEIAKEIIQNAKRDGRIALLFLEASRIMQEYQIETVDFWTIDLRKNVSFPAVLKVDSDKILHKTDQKGLVLNIKDGEELNSEIEKMQAGFPGSNLIIQPMLARQMELIVGIKRDANFGPVVVYGLGGIYAEVFKMIDFLVQPLSAAEIKSSLLKSKLGFIFRITRSQAAYDAESFSQLLWKVWLLANEVEEIREFDINPLLAYNDGRGDVAVDVKIIV
jgi:acetyltransferase